MCFIIISVCSCLIDPNIKLIVFNIVWLALSSDGPSQYTAISPNKVTRVVHITQSNKDGPSVEIKILKYISPIRFRAWSQTGVMYYDACFMHLTPGVVHNLPKAVGV